VTPAAGFTAALPPERVGTSEDAAATDAQLLERFVADHDEAAFAALVRRHGPLVYNVCRRVLRHPDDAEDAFQVTFLVLVRKAPAIRSRAALGGWLHQVAHRVALRARAARRPAEPYPDAGVAAPDAAAPLESDLRRVLDEEVQRLPAKYRAAVVLFYLSGHSTEEAARQLGCPRGTVLSRLAWARERLRKCLTRRGVALSAAALAAWLAREGAAAAAAPPPLIGSTVRAATGLALGKATAGLLPARAATLMEGVLRSMFLTNLKRAAVAALAALAGLGAGLWGRLPAAGETPGGLPEAAALRPAPGEPRDRPPEAAARRAAAPRTRVALVNLSYVLKNADEVKAFREDFKKQAAFYQQRLEASRARIEAWRKESSAPGLAADRREALERDVRAEQRKLQDEQEEARRKLAKTTDAQTAALYKKVREAAARYAAAHDIELVLQYNDPADEAALTSPQNVQRRMQAVGCAPLYAAPGLDISKEIVAVLNAAHGKAGTPRSR
jgi:RNA polymerase sigma factor (sigma-70 family)